VNEFLGSIKGGEFSDQLSDYQLLNTLIQNGIVRGPFEKFVDWWQCATVMQREA